MREDDVARRHLTVRRRVVIIHDLYAIDMRAAVQLATAPGRPGKWGAPGAAQTPAAGLAYQYCVVAAEQLTTCPTISGRSNTDWIATRPGPSSVSQAVLACHRAELNQ